MKHLLRVLFLLTAAVLLTTAAVAETAETGEDQIIATVNGEELLYAQYAAFESSYLTSYQNSGIDLTDESNYAYVQDLALTAAIEEMILRQDMTAQGCYDFDEETEAWLAEQGKAAYEQALSDVGQMLKESLSLTDEDDLSVYALAYAEALGVTEQDYIDVYRTQYASVNYYDWLMKDAPITEEEVNAIYEERVASSQTLYAEDIAAFETAVSAGEEVWYTPAGYRSVLQILLSVEGGTDDEKLAGAKAQIDEITARLEGGESFESLIAEYGSDANFDEESFYSVGYRVHPDSVVWEDAFVAAAFSEEMAQPGDWSEPFASDLGVHILYYLGDIDAGPVEMTEDLYDVLAYNLYTERVQTLLSERLDALADSADVVIY